MGLMNIQDWIVERQRLLERIKELEAENTELKKRLGEEAIPAKHEPTAMRTLSLQEKVELFRSLFRGREDIFARRWYSKASGKEIVLHTKDSNDDTLRLQHQGISVIVNSNLSICTAIIDKSTIWYGSVNILGYRSAEDNLIRFKNPEIATSLLETLHKDS